MKPRAKIERRRALVGCFLLSKIHPYTHHPTTAPPYTHAHKQTGTQHVRTHTSKHSHTQPRNHATTQPHTHARARATTSSLKHLHTTTQLTGQPQPRPRSRLRTGLQTARVSWGHLHPSKLRLHSSSGNTRLCGGSCYADSRPLGVENRII